MLERAIKLREPIKIFLTMADEKFGPITTIRRDGKITAKIPWSAFQLSDKDWERARLCATILTVRALLS